MKDSEGQVGSGPALERKACGQVRFGTALGDRTDEPSAPGTAVRDAFDGQVGSGMAVLGAFERQVRDKRQFGENHRFTQKKQWFSKFWTTWNRRLWLSGGSNGSGEVPSDDDFAEHGRWKLHWRPGMPKLGGLWTLKPDFKSLGFLVSPRTPVEPFV